MHVMLMTQEPAFWRKTQMRCALFYKQSNAHACGCDTLVNACQFDTEEKKIVE